MKNLFIRIILSFTLSAAILSCTFNLYTERPSEPKQVIEHQYSEALFSGWRGLSQSTGASSALEIVSGNIDTYQNQKDKMTEIIFEHLYELDNILFELPMWPYIWQVIEMLSQTELDHFILCATVV